MSGENYTDNLQIISIIGEGSVGRVYLGFDKRLGREVAIKELMLEKLGENKDRIIARFLREAKVTGRLEHPGIIPIYELDTKPDGSYFYLMRHMKGKTLQDAILECKGSQEETFRARLRYLDNFINLCEAVGFAHSKGVIHRDLKLSNIIIGEFGETIILDWGIAKILKEDDPDENEKPIILPSEDYEDTLKTRQGALLGTPSYMSPEQIDKRFGEIIPATDVYSLGVILFILLTGKRPYSEKNMEVLKLIVNDKPSPSPKEELELVSPELSAICEKGMSKDQNKRFKNAAEMAHELRAYRDGRLVSIYAYSKTELLKRFVARNKIAISAVIGIFLSIIVGAGFALKFGFMAHKAQIKAEHSLVEITDLSEVSAKLARSFTDDMQLYFENLSADLKQTAAQLKNIDHTKADLAEPYFSRLKRKYPDATSFKLLAPEKIKDSYISEVFKNPEGEYSVSVQSPVYQGSNIVGIVSAEFRTDRLIPAAINFNPLASDYQIWCMQNDGLIIYDEDPNQIGKFLFSDQMYAKFPELHSFGQRVTKEEWGIGNYSFAVDEDDKVTFKVAAWSTATPLNLVTWKIVITKPYIQK